MTLIRTAETDPTAFSTDALPLNGMMVSWRAGRYQTARRGEAGEGLLLLDIRSLRPDIPAAVQRLRREAGGKPLVVFADNEDAAEMLECFEAGVDGCILKDVPRSRVNRYLDLVRLGERVFPFALASHLTRGHTLGRQRADLAPGEAQLSRREMQILRHVAAGASNKVIAQALGVCEATVKVHVKSIHRKLNVENRTQAALWAVTHGVPMASLGGGNGSGNDDA